ncbi:O-succinylbenzoate-CoA ligase [Bifidobacterium bohemicum]|uniref:2-succinylbenzoate--CoA ligase n=1 Tax=Bifidobacterium bohemicum DSM 22767 TaxID=1437606 RepID=A0A086ZHE8_9BIFI|nr:o-succinylbenzoate--CoA ligase [Bifidobacterium bohemicum]KFI45948.1 o-succinylbenzoate--CoA ligase [Bifidobacterium bohemicum DSM 22767]SCC14400.1 O-succinylbenzoate-CoA ligase [Bifidobacterium bohemicum]
MDNWVLRRVMLTPERVAVDDGEVRYTFADVFKQAQRLGAVLDEYGAFAAQRVAMVSNNTMRGYLLAVTLLLYGKTVVWLNKRLTDDELRQQMHDAGVVSCLKDDGLSPRLLGDAPALGEVRVIGFDEIFGRAGQREGGRLTGDGRVAASKGEVRQKDDGSIDGDSDVSVVSVLSDSVSPSIQPSLSTPSTLPSPLIPREFDDDHVVSIMFTSGSTGPAKGVQQTVRNHFVSATGVALNLGADPADEWLCAVPIFHISGYSIILRGLIFGVTVRLMGHFDAAEMERILTDEPVTWISVVPTMLKQLVSERERRAASGLGYSPSFKGFILGGEKSDSSLLERCDRLGMVVVRSYGMTETCSQIVGTAIADGLRKPLSSGKPYFTTSLKLDESSGEILVKTGALTPGYINRPGALEAKKTTDGWYRTGDVGHFDEDGYLYVDGRLDNMLISGGEHVFPEEIERIYADCPYVDEIAVTAETDETWGEVPVAYVVAHGADGSLTARLRDFGRERLPHYKVPHRFYLVETLPRTSTGKIRRFLLGRCHTPGMSLA